MPHAWGYALQQLLNTVQLASFYLPLAVAFAIMQAITRRIFLSFGDFAMFASFAALYSCFASLVRGEPDIAALLWALAFSVACGAALGAAIARLVLGERLLQSPLAFMIGSVGISIALQELMRLQSQSRDIWVPPLFAGQSVFALAGSYPVRLPLMAGLAIMIGILAVAVALGVLRWTRFGLYWQACSQSLRLARLCGINSLAVAAWSFAMAGALAGVTGWTSAISYGGANFSIGLMVGFKAMFASVIGGFGSLRGAVAGACALAAIEVAWSAVFSTAYRDVAVFAIIVIVLLLRPEGLTGIANQRESETE